MKKFFLIFLSLVFVLGLVSTVEVHAQAGDRSIKKRRDKSEVLEEIRGELRERKKRMQALMRENPPVFLKQTFSSAERASLPEELQEYVEEYTEVRGGELVVLHTDFFEEQRSEEQFFIQERVGPKGREVFKRFNLVPIGDFPRLLSGSILNVRGVRLGDDIVVDLRKGVKYIGPREDDYYQEKTTPRDTLFYNVLFPSAQAQVLEPAVEVVREADPDALGSQRLAIILIRPKGVALDSLPTKEEVAEVIFRGLPKKFFDEASYGKFSLLGDVSDVYGWYEGRDDITPQNIDDVTEGIKPHDDEIDFKKYDRVMTGVARGGGGHGYVGKETVQTKDGEVRLGIGTFGIPDRQIFLSFHDQKTLRGFPHIIAHELGHTLGVYHAKSWVCVQGLRGDCRENEYGNPFDTMGSGTEAAHFNGYFKAVFRWLTNKEKSLMVIEKPGVYILKPLEEKQAVVALVKQPGVLSPEYYVEYRRPIGFDSEMRGSVVLVNWKHERLGSRILITNLSQQVFPLLPGKSFFNERSGIRINHVREDSVKQELHISVDFERPQCIRDIHLFKVTRPDPNYEEWVGGHSIYTEVEVGKEALLFIEGEYYNSFTCDGRTDLQFKTDSPSGWPSSPTSLSAGTNNFGGNTRIFVPNDVKPREYPVRLRIYDAVSGEAVERTARINVVSEQLRPDLQVSLLGVQDATTKADFAVLQVVAGQKVVIRGEIRNQGKKKSGIFLLTLHLRKLGSIIDTIGSGPIINLWPGQVIPLEYNWVVPPNLKGWYEIFFSVDLKNQVEEEHEYNNVDRMSILVGTLPDLSGSITLPKKLNPDVDLENLRGWEKIVFEVEIKNKGGGDSDSFVAAVKAFKVGITPPKTIGLAEFQALGAGETLVIQNAFTIPEDWSGKYTISLTVDSRDDVEESEEGNNFFSLPLIVGKLPDLTGSLNLPKERNPGIDLLHLAPGDNLVFEVEISNIGKAASGDAEYALEAFTFLTLDKPAEFLLGRTSFALQPGSSRVWQVPWTIPQDFAGALSVNLYIDNRNQVEEGREDNNLLSTMIKVEKPGDADRNGKVDILDLSLVGANLGSKSNPNLDFNKNGEVDVFDVVIVAKNWGGEPFDETSYLILRDVFTPISTEEQTREVVRRASAVIKRRDISQDMKLKIIESLRIIDVIAVEALIESLSDEDEIIRLKAKDVLSAISVPSVAVEPLIKSLHDVSTVAYARKSAARILGRIGSRLYGTPLVNTIREALLKAAQNPFFEETVRKALADLEFKG